MQRIVEFRVTVPTIELNRWMPTPDDELRFSFEEGKFKGQVFLCLDETMVDYHGIHFEPYPESDEVEIIEEPVTCWQVVIRVDGYSTETTTNGEFLRVAHKLTIEYLSRFASYIKFELGQYWVDLGLMPEWNTYRFLREVKAKWIAGEGKAVVSLGGIPPLSRHDLHSLYLSERGVNPLGVAHWEQMQDVLSSNEFIETIDLSKKLIVEAKKHLKFGEYSIAAIEAITALEIKVETFIQQRFDKVGITKKHFKESISEATPQTDKREIVEASA